MYNRHIINKLLNFINNQNGKADKQKLANLTKEIFILAKDRSVYYCEDFAIRFSQSNSKNMANTVLALSALKKYDNRPFFVCIVTPAENYMLLANTTCLSKISHSSHELRMDNIKGSFNGSDIMRTISNIENKEANFEKLYLFHENFTFTENLTRLVENTNQITPTGEKFQPSSEELKIIYNAPIRAKNFLESKEYQDLKKDLDERVKEVQNEIAIAAFIDNVNIRGRIIEYLITSNDNTLKDQLIACLRNKKPLPHFKTEDNLGDFSKNYPNYYTETEIKTKVLSLASNPKAYNIDKLLRYLAKEKSVYLIYLLGIDDRGEINLRLCSVFDQVLLNGTVFLNHWSGRNSRGVTQFYGSSLISALEKAGNYIDLDTANQHIKIMLAL